MEIVMNTKKLFSVVLAVILIVGCVGITATAESGTVTVSLLGEKQAVAGEEYEVILNVEETSADLVGGISCDIEYDKDKFELNRVEISQEFANANHLENGRDSINTTTTGVAKVILLDVNNDSANTDWITLVFTVKAEQETSAEFKLENVKVSDSTGTQLVTNNLTVEVTNIIYDHIIDVNGASIRKDGVGNIRFEAEIDANVDKTKVAEVGFLMIPAVCLKDGLYNGDLTLTNDFAANDTEQKYHLYTMANGKKISIASNSKEISKLGENETKVYCYLTNTINYNLTTSFAARAYVKMTDGTIIYSDNQTYIEDSKTYEKNIKGGTSSKSCIETAKAIYNLYKDNAEFTDGFKTIIAKDSWNTTEYKTIVSELAKVEESFN